ncbi:hypothetical protein GALL_409300 [mine drainage metagenome]|uniref:Uncharacterized protein n=1 Tax=mine drainage metagenome TaxID=410659 RepID=A0A1J5QMZ6_9ZZZZ
MIQSHVRVLKSNLADHVFPELESFQDVGFVDAGNTLAAFACGLKGDVGNALNFRLAVAHGVEGLLGTRKMSIAGDASATRLAKVNISREFANDQQVKPGNQFWLEARSVDQLLIANGRAQIGKQPQVLAQTQNGLFRAQVSLKVVVFPVANSTKQNGISVLGQFQGCFRQRVTLCFIGCSAYWCGVHFELELKCQQNLHRFSNNFGPDAITWQDCNFHGDRFLCG